MGYSYTFVILISSLLIQGNAYPNMDDDMDIEVQASSNELESLARAEGLKIEDVTNKDRNTYKITDSDLLKYAQYYIGNAARVQSVKIDNSNPLKKTTYPHQTKILETKTVPQIVTHQKFTNKFSNTAVFSCLLSHALENAASNSWSTETEVSTSANVNYGIDIGFLSYGGEINIGYSSAFGEDKSKTVTGTITSENSVVVPVPGGKVAFVIIQASKGYMIVEVSYEQYLTGDIIAYLNREVSGTKEPRIDINQLLYNNNQTIFHYIKEQLRIDFFSDAAIKVVDQTHKLLERPASIHSSNSEYQQSSFHPQKRAYYHYKVQQQNGLIPQDDD